MPPKSRKRKVTSATGTNASNGTVTAPYRATWPGWVEMESEPAFFNVMLKDMGVRGVKVQEVYGLDDEALAILPQPVHALIFLFRYREPDKATLGTECPPHVWYAEQVPDFACASVALLNIINNIPDLRMGKELRDFKDFTQDMDPHSRGDAIDDFTFLKQIHNSFANDTDILEADMCYKEKLAAANKRQAVAKAVKTKAAKAAAKAACHDKSNTVTPTKSPVPETSPAPKRGSKDSPAPNTSATPIKSTNDTPASGRQTRSASKLEHTATTSATPEPNTRKSTPSKGATGTPVPHELTNGSKHRDNDGPAQTFKTNGVVDDSASELTEPESSPAPKARANQSKKLRLEAPKLKLDPDGDFGSSTKTETLPQSRRSGRQPKPRKDLEPQSETEDTGPRKPASKSKTTAVEAEAEEEGFHFCAYMPIGKHVWKLDGMDKFPQDMGAIDLEGGQTWLNIVQPEIQARMLNYEEGAIEFNLMSLVHDPLITTLDDLAANVRAIQEIEKRLTGIVDDWKEMEGTETGPEVVLGPSAQIGITQLDIDRAPISDKALSQLDAASEDLLKLLDRRRDRISQQAPLRAACRDEVESASRDAEHARHRRHDYLGFVRQWMEALADQQQLWKVLEGVI